jgi:hypothetical protein
LPVSTKIEVKSDPGNHSPDAGMIRNGTEGKALHKYRALGLELPVFMQEVLI